jgi:hypothetical protein
MLFFRDLSTIREKTIKLYTIKHTFRDSGIWPISYKTVLKKMCEYSKKKATQAIPELIDLIELLPTSYFQYENRLYK